MARCTNASSLSGVRSYDLDRRRDRFSQPNVLFHDPSLRLDLKLSTRTSDDLHDPQPTGPRAQRTTALYAWSAQMIFGEFHDFAETPPMRPFAPSRSWTSPDVMTSVQRSPSVSTTMCRLRPQTFFPPRRSHVGPLARLSLTVWLSSTAADGLGVFPACLRTRSPQFRVNGVPRAGLFATDGSSETQCGRAAGFMRQRSPTCNRCG